LAERFTASVVLPVPPLYEWNAMTFATKSKLTTIYFNLVDCRNGSSTRIALLCITASLAG
jgi:hypothetical protein